MNKKTLEVEVKSLGQRYNLAEKFASFIEQNKSPNEMIENARDELEEVKESIKKHENNEERNKKYYARKLSTLKGAFSYG